MRDALATATMFTGFAALVAAVASLASFVGTTILMPALTGLVDYASSIDVAARVVG